MSRLASPDMLVALLDQLACEGVTAELPVRGISMRPFLRDGDRLRLAPASVRDVPLGAVVAQLGEARPLTHRLIARWRGRNAVRILTKGDACLRLDPPRRAEGFLLLAVAVRRGEAVHRLDRGWRRWFGLAIGWASLATGLGVEAWDRLSGRRRSP